MEPIPVLTSVAGETGFSELAGGADSYDSAVGFAAARPLQSVQLGDLTRKTATRSIARKVCHAPRNSG